MKETTPGPAMSKPNFLRRVVERVPKPHYETDKFLGTRMVAVHMLEKLECGHSKDAFPQFDPLTARYRICTVCAQEQASDSLPEKKPVAIVRMPNWRKAA